MLWLAAPIGTTVQVHRMTARGTLLQYASDAGSYMGRLPRPPLLHQGPIVRRVQRYLTPCRFFCGKRSRHCYAHPRLSYPFEY